MRRSRQCSTVPRRSIPLLGRANTSRFGELVEAAQGADNGIRLLYGLAAIGAPERVTAPWGGSEWLADLLHISPTGEVWRMVDAYGTRFGMIAGFSHGDKPSVFLFDIEGSEAVRLASAGAFDDVDQAAAAWPAEVGESADGVMPRPVSGPEDLLCLSNLAINDDDVFGDESRVVMDNWFRAHWLCERAKLPDHLRERVLAATK